MGTAVSRLDEPLSVATEPTEVDKIVILGGSCVGKTELSKRIIQLDSFSAEHQIAAAERSGGVPYLKVHDLSDLEDCRLSFFSTTRVVLLVFSVREPHTLSLVEPLWQEFVVRLEGVMCDPPKVPPPLLLVGLQRDIDPVSGQLLPQLPECAQALREARGNVAEAESDAMVNEAEARAVAEKVGAQCYLEVSSRTGHNIDVLRRMLAEMDFRSPAGEGQLTKPAV
mmetsp:Transcript_24940/g.62634  ORF Transcript_24940/g.62634 Transcript_24940/m.62634 type:complete len:225 (-) Transcript_24940:1016-1690(-)